MLDSSSFGFNVEETFRKRSGLQTHRSCVCVWWRRSVVRDGGITGTARRHWQLIHYTMPSAGPDRQTDRHTETWNLGSPGVACRQSYQRRRPLCRLWWWSMLTVTLRGTFYPTITCATWLQSVPFFRSGFHQPAAFSHRCRYRRSPLFGVWWRGRTSDAAILKWMECRRSENGRNLPWTCSHRHNLPGKKWHVFLGRGICLEKNLSGGICPGFAVVNIVNTLEIHCLRKKVILFIFVIT